MIKKNMEQKIDYDSLPVKKGDILNIGVRSIGKNGDLMFKYRGYCLFLKNFKDTPVKLRQMISVKVVKIFQKLGYVELYKKPQKCDGKI